MHCTARCIGEISDNKFVSNFIKISAFCCNPDDDDINDDYDDNDCNDNYDDDDCNDDYDDINDDCNGDHDHDDGDNAFTMMMMLTIWS
jgi:hypothetical protein